MIDYKYEFNEWLESEQNKQNNRKTYRKKFIGSRGYPHFDSTVSLDNAEQIGKLQQFTYSPKSLLQWKFLPFIRKDQRNRKFKHNLAKLRPIASTDQKQYTHIKSRPIMYASHYDACVFSFIGFILTRYYEEELGGRNLTNNVIAYRSIKGFNNISFAKQAFDFMEKSNELKICDRRRSY